MSIGEWIVNLAAAYAFELKPALTKQYLKILASWRLSPDQWEELNARALIRHEYFPRISQLFDIACELVQESAIRNNSQETLWPGDKPAIH